MPEPDAALPEVEETNKNTPTSVIVLDGSNDEWLMECAMESEMKEEDFQVKLLHQSKNVTKTSITECKRWSLTTIVATVTALLAVLITWCTRTLLLILNNTVLDANILYSHLKSRCKIS